MENIEELDADLGYIKRYANELHSVLATGYVLSPNSTRHIKDALKNIRGAWIAVDHFDYGKHIGRTEKQS